MIPINRCDDISALLVQVMEIAEACKLQARMFRDDLDRRGVKFNEEVTYEHGDRGFTVVRRSGLLINVSHLDCDRRYDDRDGMPATYQVTHDGQAVMLSHYRFGKRHGMHAKIQDGQVAHVSFYEGPVEAVLYSEGKLQFSWSYEADAIPVPPASPNESCEEAVAYVCDVVRALGSFPDDLYPYVADWFPDKPKLDDFARRIAGSIEFAA